MSKKEAVLLIGRGKMFHHYIQGMIDVFQNDYEVLIYEFNGLAPYSGNFTQLKIQEIENNSGSDFWAKIKRIEQKINLNLFESYSNYLYYGRLAQEANIDYSSYWRSKKSLAKEFFESYRFINSVMANYTLKFVFHDTIDMILLQVIEACSIKYNFGFYHTLIKPGPFDNRALLSHGIARKSALFTKFLNEDIIPTANEKSEINTIVAQFSQEKPALSYLKNSSQKLITLNEIKKIPSKLKNIPYGWKRFWNRYYIQKQVADFSLAKAGKYILFFLSHQPEATTTSAASKYVDQWKIIEELAVHGPSDINIVIKAHPFGYGWQGKEYFERLLRLENVMMAPISFSGKELIQNAHTVITINGSIGLEALIYDVPAYTLGDAWYSHPGLIEDLVEPRELLALLDNPKQICLKDKYKILAAAYRSSFEFIVNFSEGFEDKKRQSGRNLAEHILKNRNIYFTRVGM